MIINYTKDGTSSNVNLTAGAVSAMRLAMAGHYSPARIGATSKEDAHDKMTAPVKVCDLSIPQDSAREVMEAYKVCCENLRKALCEKAWLCSNGSMTVDVTGDLRRVEVESDIFTAWKNVMKFYGFTIANKDDCEYLYSGITTSSKSGFRGADSFRKMCELHAHRRLNGIGMESLERYEKRYNERKSAAKKAKKAQKAATKAAASK